MREDKTERRELPKVAYSIPQFCEITTLGRSLTYEEIGKGNLRVVKVGRRTLIPASEVERWLRRLASKKGAGK